MFAIQPAVFRPAGLVGGPIAITEFTVPQDAAAGSDGASAGGFDTYVAQGEHGDTAFAQALAAVGLAPPGAPAGGSSSPSSALGIAPIPTPLPSSWLLLAGGLSFLLALRRRVRA